MGMVGSGEYWKNLEQTRRFKVLFVSFYNVSYF